MSWSKTLAPTRVALPMSQPKTQAPTRVALAARLPEPRASTRAALPTRLPEPWAPRGWLCPCHSLRPGHPQRVALPMSQSKSLAPTRVALPMSQPKTQAPTRVALPAQLPEPRASTRTALPTRLPEPWAPTRVALPAWLPEPQAFKIFNSIATWKSTGEERDNVRLGFEPVTFGFLVLCLIHWARAIKPVYKNTASVSGVSCNFTMFSELSGENSKKYGVFGENSRKNLENRSFSRSPKERGGSGQRGPNEPGPTGFFPGVPQAQSDPGCVCKTPNCKYHVVTILLQDGLH
ncbi:hypothetical protein XELAEV_18012958mg [Xenopus laevis]|uniref:Uncharacterized protein n=1 Tax=Xenopus laevis TaxID=8355 RepID=A0A974DNJ8_XENLA|nr:hypothetical protein XELAEV_18012958mg [Xenopus laevis]